MAGGWLQQGELGALPAAGSELSPGHGDMQQVLLAPPCLDQQG